MSHTNASAVITRGYGSGNAGLVISRGYTGAGPTAGKLCGSINVYPALAGSGVNVYPALDDDGITVEPALSGDITLRRCD